MPDNRGPEAVVQIPAEATPLLLQNGDGLLPRHLQIQGERSSPQRLGKQWRGEIEHLPVVLGEVEIARPDANHELSTRVIQGNHANVCRLLA